MKIIITLFITIFSYINCFTQTLISKSVGSYSFVKQECISDAEHSKIANQLEKNKLELYKNGLLPLPKKTRSVGLDWPMKQAAGFSYPNYYAISNYVDHNPLYPNQITDFNCGTHSYDLSSGYNHSGTDYYLWPFSWTMFRANQIEIAAAAAGTIIGKSDGNPDSSCAMNSNTWNAVYVQHSDGSVAWYGHMKSGTLTTKSIGASVAVGEKLGNIGSSGSSTGPHLHFELYDASNNLIDPYSGPCNNITSWWNTPRYYKEPTLNANFTHNATGPIFNTCPASETTNFKDTFIANDYIMFSSFYRDQAANSYTDYYIYQPDGSLFTYWNNAPSIDYENSYWLWTYQISPAPKVGIWSYVATYNGKTATHNFYVQGISAPLNINDFVFSANKNNGNNVSLFWQNTNEKDIETYEIEKSNNGIDFEKIKTVSCTQSISYFYNDDSKLFENNYYRIKIINNDKTFYYSKTILIKNDNNSLIISPNPANTEITISGATEPIYIVNTLGKIVVNKTNNSKINTTYLSNGLYFLISGDKKSKLLVQH